MKHVRAIVFDLYGTLFDVHSVAVSCDTHFPGRGAEMSVLWRQKQLEYSWLRSLMGRYAGFEALTEDSLVFTANQLGLALNAESRSALCEAYLKLHPFPEVPAALETLKARGLPLAILSNGSHRSIDAVVRHAGLLDRFAQLISVEDVQIFKPHPTVYELGEQRLGVPRSAILFVSSNPWDVTGAACFGYRTCWVNRRHAVFDEMGQRPEQVVGGLDGLAAAFSAPNPL